MKMDFTPNRTRLLIAGLALVILAILLWLLLRGNGEDELTLYGNVDIRQVELGFRVSGRLEGLHFEEGDTVAAGQVMAVLDQAPFEDEVRHYEAEVAAASASLEKLTRGTRPEEIAEARAIVAEREASLANAKRLLKRREELVERGAVSKAAFEDARAAVDEAEARLTAANKSLELALNGARVEDIAVAEANLDAARARLATAETALADAELHAPANGIILSRIREPGAILSAGAPVYTLSLTKPVWVRAYVAEPQLGHIHPGMAVEVVTDSRPDFPYTGQIGFISPVAEFTPKAVETPDLRTDLVFRLRIVISDPDEGLRQGMPVTIRLPLPEKAEATPAEDAR